MKQKTRDLILAVLSVCGIFYIIGKYTGIMFYIFEATVSLNMLKMMVIFESAIFLIAGLVVWEKVNVSKDYHKYFIYSLVILLALDLAYVLIVLFR